MVKRKNQQKNIPRKNLQKKIFFLLLIFVLLLGSLNLAKARGWLIQEQEPPEIIDNAIRLSSLTLDQKIAQMIIVAGRQHNQEAWKRLQLGGIHLFAMQDEEVYQQTIRNFQSGMAIPFFVTADLEGCRSPFAHFQEFTPASEIKSAGQAYEAGTEEGKFLVSLGFTVNFAPVVDLEDAIWRCRSFPGDETVVAELAEAYILGIQNEGIIATAKHYPGKTLVVRDPHKFLVEAEIEAKDIYPYDYLIQKGKVEAIMVSHVIPSGVISSSTPSVASPALVGALKMVFPNLIISDEINMLGLKKFYPRMEDVYVAVFKAGNDLIINFNDDPQEIYRMIQVVKKAVQRGEIPVEQLDRSVQKILETKGFRVQ
ncbi:MAG: glycoside hydrolase family 3 N-terminal domain-containing protein [Nanoarchaeota archaeon]